MQINIKYTKNRKHGSLKVIRKWHLWAHNRHKHWKKTPKGIGNILPRNIVCLPQLISRVSKALRHVRGMQRDFDSVVRRCWWKRRGRKPAASQISSRALRPLAWRFRPSQILLHYSVNMDVWAFVCRQSTQTRVWLWILCEHTCRFLISNFVKRLH